MNDERGVSRRTLLAKTGAAAGMAMLPKWLWAADAPADPAELIRQVKDDEIRAGFEAAVLKNLIPSALERAYPGHFVINADGGGYGSDTTWPGLDSWQMAGAYLLLGRTRIATDYFDFVRASQRRDGNIPFAIFNGDTRPGGCLRGLKWPDDVFTYVPPKREGLPASSQETRKWIGLFEHWQTKGYPLGALGPVCYVLTAAEIFDTTKSVPWLKERLTSLEAAAKYLLTMKKDHGLVGGSGFYTELPPREGCDGVTQCYCVHAYRELARLYRAAGDKAKETEWASRADELTKAFVEAFWRGDHFGEYVHPERGLIDTHGLSDTNWAAVAFGIATGPALDKLWPRLINEKGFWYGDMTTQPASKPLNYEAWETYVSPECSTDKPFNDVAAMGRVWYLEALACTRMKAHERLVESARLVSRASRKDGYWRERYWPNPDGTATPARTEKYCEYAAVLIRVVLSNRDLFMR
jgi:hypothetical protein